MIPHPDACQAYDESMGLEDYPEHHCTRPAGHAAGLHVSLSGEPIPGAMGLGRPTTVIHVRDLVPVPPAGEQDPPSWDLYLGRPMPRHPDARVRKGSALRNRWKVDEDGPLETVLAMYLGWLQAPAGRAALDHLTQTPGGLAGRRLACWCVPVGMVWTAQDPIRCHAQMIAACCDGLDPAARYRETWVH